MPPTIHDKPIILIGYSGHGFVAADIFLASGKTLYGYCDHEEKSFNPFRLSFSGSEQSQQTIDLLKQCDYFISVGENLARRKIYNRLIRYIQPPVNAIHPSSVISGSVQMGTGVMVAANAAINPLSKIGDGVICNTSSSIDHECTIGKFVHIAPGAVLCGNVTVGDNSFIGANAVVRQGIFIGNNVVIGAGSVVVKNVPDNCVMVGNPARRVGNG